MYSQELFRLQVWEGLHQLCAQRAEGIKTILDLRAEELAHDLQQAIENGRQLQELMNEAGVRFVNVLKLQRQGATPRMT